MKRFIGYNKIAKDFPVRTGGGLVALGGIAMYRGESADQLVTQLDVLRWRVQGHDFERTVDDLLTYRTATTHPLPAELPAVLFDQVHHSRAGRRIEHIVLVEWGPLYLDARVLGFILRNLTKGAVTLSPVWKGTTPMGLIEVDGTPVAVIAPWVNANEIAGEKGTWEPPKGRSGAISQPLFT